MKIERVGPVAESSRGSGMKACGQQKLTLRALLALALLAFFPGCDDKIEFPGGVAEYELTPQHIEKMARVRDQGEKLYVMIWLTKREKRELERLTTRHAGGRIHVRYDDTIIMDDPLTLGLNTGVLLIGPLASMQDLEGFMSSVVAENPSVGIRESYIDMY